MKFQRPIIPDSTSDMDDIDRFKKNFIDILEQVIAKDEFTATNTDLFKALAHLVRTKMMKNWINTQQTYHKLNKKRVYLLSHEFLIGRLLEDSILNLGIEDELKQALKDMEIDLNSIIEEEPDAGLGKGGLGRLAACFLDSMSTLQIPAHGYGIRYNYASFKQDIQNGAQLEKPEDWLKNGNPWENERAQYAVEVKYYGKTEYRVDVDGNLRIRWEDTQNVVAMPYDIPIPGFGTNIVNTLRLWSSQPAGEFNFDYKSHGDYLKACENIILSENISKILYPHDSIGLGQELRLKQQYFYTSATIQDIIRRYKQHNEDLTHLPDKAVIQLHGTFPSLAIPETMRILIDEEGLSWEDSWNITNRLFAYSCHKLEQDNLEYWPVELVNLLLPRILEIIFEINHRFLKIVTTKFPDDYELTRRTSIIEEGDIKMVRMPNLACISSFSINGVSHHHTELIKKHLLHDFYKIFPEKFNTKTNGITPRRWLFDINEHLSNFIEKTIGHNWITDLHELKKLSQFTRDNDFVKKWGEIKKKNKEKLAKYILNEYGIEVNTEAIFDIHAKRVHPYKRQLLCLMHAIYLYNKIRNNDDENFHPRVVIFSGKAAPDNSFAKLIIKFINYVADKINNDPRCFQKLNVIFLKDYNVSLASKIIPACDLSEQISTAGFEPSGTSNMKFSLNGALTIGTYDGSNIEMMEEIGDDNFFIFGLKDEDIRSMRIRGYNPWDYYQKNKDLKEIIDMIENGYFASGNRSVFRPIYDSLMAKGDYYMIMADFESYIKLQNKLTALYKNTDEWNITSIHNVAKMGKFSSDNTIQEYSKEIWKVPAYSHINE